MFSERIQELVTLYANNTCTKSELLELLQIIEQGEHDKALENALSLFLRDLKPEDSQIAGIDKEKIFSNIIRAAKVVPLYKRSWLRRSAAAAILLMGGVLYFNNSYRKQQVASNIETLFKNDVAPGGNKAILILSNGQSIHLANAQNGRLAEQGTAIITKTKAGQIVYKELSNKTVGQQAMNLIQTPRSGKWDITLSDGTRVWLNASSSLRYPSVFTGNERKVEITGEAYFEVAHNAQRPFKVVTNSQIVEVLGTHFNINAYADENEVKTTLLQGKVRVVKGDKAAILMPGQQSVIQPTQNIIKVRDADTDLVIAWHNGYFQFDRSDIRTVMRELSRWYDVDIRFEGNVTTDKFGGSIPRDATLGQVLKTLQQSMVHFKIDGKTVTVLN